MRIALIVSFILGLGIANSPARAAGKGTSVEARGKAARKACMMGDYAKGTEILSDLFVETNELTWVYNAARCFEQNHRWEESLDRFLEFQRKTPGASADDKADVEQHIAECRSHIKESAAGASAAVAPVSAPVAVAPAPPVAAPAPVRLIAPVPAQDAHDGSALRLTGVIVGAVGLAAIGAGVYCSVKSYDVRDDTSKVDSYKTAGYISYGVGAAAVATGITLYVIGRDKSAGEYAPVALVPAFAPGVGAVLVRGHF
jgi:hypothetical protein